MNRHSKLLLILFLSVFVFACAPTTPPQLEPTPTVTAPSEPVLSAEPLQPASREQVIFAQSALKKLGYRVGTVDGLWGPRSAAAIREFEQINGVSSANGFLSELNLDLLAKQSGLDPNAIQPRAPQPKGIASKLSAEPLSKGPQLVIVERDYQVFAEPNPYSEELAILQSGTGVYILNENAGWYQIESINRMRGYIQAD